MRKESKSSKIAKAVWAQINHMTEAEIEVERNSQEIGNALTGKVYSVKNQIAMLIQYPDVTKVAGYQQWLTLGRRVIKGENGLVIFRPSKVKHEEEGGEETMRMFFNTSVVFDIRQTDVEPE